jgi:ABC-type nitrate/sulfonate/bicarbonate transport system substrate-binding protein
MQFTSIRFMVMAMVWAALMVSFLLLAGDVRWSSALEKLHVATPVQSIAELPLIVAMRNGYFRAEGLEVHRLVVQPEFAVRALAAGEVDFSLAWDAPIRAALAGTPIKIIAAIAARPMHVFVVRPEIRSGSDLRKKIIGVDVMSSRTDDLARLVARYFGLEPDNHVEVVEIGSSTERLTALKDGTIQATLLDPVTAVKAAVQGFRTLLRAGDINDSPVLGVAAATPKLTGQRQQAVRFLRALLRGARFIKKYRADTVEIIRGHVRVAAAHGALIYDAAHGSFAEDGLVSERVLALSVWRAQEGRSNTAAVRLGRVADWSLVRELAAARSQLPFWLRPYDN